MDIDRLTELAQKILQVDDTERKYKAVANLQQKIVEDIGSVLSCCADLVEENTALRFGSYQSNIYRMYGMYSVPRRCLLLLTNARDVKRVVEYEQDTEEKRADRQEKLKRLQGFGQTQRQPKLIEHNARTGIRKVVEWHDENPDNIYREGGTYRRYSEVCNSFDYCLCRKIQQSRGGDLKTLFQKVCLYIALKNERAMMREELLLCGIDVPADEGKQPQELNKGIVEACTLPTDTKPHYNNDDKQQATKQFKALVERGYLPSETRLSDWLYIYGADCTNPNSEPLKWQKSQSELGYLVQSVWGDTDPQRLWAICECVFTINSVKPNTQTIKSNLSNISNGFKSRPKSYDALDNVLRA